MIKAWTDEVWEDFQYWLKQDKRTLKQILLLQKALIQRFGSKNINKIPTRVLSGGETYTR